MGESVYLAKAIEPSFPERCVVCDQPNNDEFAEIRGEAVGFNGFRRWIAQETGKLKVPAHKPCSRKLKRRLFWRNIGILTLATILAVGWFTLGIYEVEMPFEFSRNNLCIAGFVIFVPILALEQIYPAAFEFRDHGEEIEYEFKCILYASEFKMLNKASGEGNKSKSTKKRSRVPKIIKEKIRDE